MLGGDWPAASPDVRRVLVREWAVSLRGVFTPYEEDVQRRLEDAVDKGEDRCEIDVGGRVYVVDLEPSRMRQRLKADPAKWRAVRLVEPNCVLLAQRLSASRKQVLNHQGAPRSHFWYVLWYQ